MHIAIDARAWNWTGVGRYIRALVREYARMEHPHTFVLLMPDDDAAVTEARELIQPQAEKFAFQPIGGGYYSWSEQLLLPVQLARVEADLFHFPHFNVPLFFGRPYVVTIHDATRFYFPGQKRQGLAQQLAYEMVFTHAVRQAKYVMCVSEHTANELQSLQVLPRPILPSLPEFPRDEPPTTVPPVGKLSIIHEGVDKQFSHPVLQADHMRLRKFLKTNDPYLLMVGVWMSHKNIPRILRAFQSMRKTHSRLKLVITGKHQPGYVDVHQLVIDLNLQDAVILPGFVPDTLLPALYEEAHALVFASLYEGFGLPALEAAAAGTPVVASNISSVPEIMEDAAEYVNPEDTADITRGIDTVISDITRREQLIAAGKRRAEMFSWKTCAEKTLVVYGMCKSSS